MTIPRRRWTWTVWLAAVVPPLIVAAVYRRFPDPFGRCHGIGFGCVPAPGEELVFLTVVGCIVGLAVSAVAILIAESKRIVTRAPVAPLVVACLWLTSATGLSYVGAQVILDCGARQRTTSGCIPPR